jgi:hypothetical protein
VVAQTTGSRNGTQHVRRFGIAAALAALVGVSGAARAAEIPTGAKDLELRLDSTFRYNFAYRTDPQDSAIIANPNADDGDRNFDRGVVSNRLDLLAELDLAYRKSYGIRASGAAWFDQRYQTGLGNDSPTTANHLVGSAASD